MYIFDSVFMNVPFMQLVFSHVVDNSLLQNDLFYTTTSFLKSRHWPGPSNRISCHQFASH